MKLSSMIFLYINIISLFIKFSFSDVNAIQVSHSPVNQLFPKLISKDVITKFDIQCILSDIDGTLISHMKPLSIENFDAINKLMISKSNCPMYLCTGRSRASAFRVLGPDMLSLFGGNIERIPGVYQQGLLVYGKTGELIHEQNLPQDMIVKVTDFAEKHGIPIIAYCRESIYCRKRCEQTDKIVQYLDPLPIEIDAGLPELFNKGISVQKLIMVDEDSKLVSIRPSLETEFQNSVGITKAVKGMLEILPFGASKGNGVDIFLQHLKISPQNTIALGDGENDIEMLKHVKYGIAMENAHPELLRIASYKTLSVNNHGVAYVINLLMNSNS